MNETSSFFTSLMPQMIHLAWCHQ